ncbi:MAG: ribosome-binding factor A [bacterium]|nr:ribosome-binding factor A [bacterium]
MNERRRERFSSLIEEELPMFFREVCELPKNSLVSILYVEVPMRAGKANVFVSVFPDEARDGVATELKMRENEATHYIRGRIKSKYAPAIHFFVR